jgi:hypothetical protein
VDREGDIASYEYEDEPEQQQPEAEQYALQQDSSEI